MSFRLINHALLAAAGVLAAVAMGCSGYSSAGVGCGIYGGACPTPTPTPPVATDCSHAPTFTAPIIVQLNLSFATCNDTTFGVIRGISDTNSASNIIKVSTGQNIQFSNVDSLPHTIDFLGTWTGSFPPADTSSAGPASAGTDIGTTNFSTGALSMGSSSLVFKTPAAPGMYVFGDRLYYGGSNMRAVVIAM